MKPWWKIWIWPRRNGTSYEWQIGLVWGSWVYVYGGHWKHWWQPSRWSIHWEHDYMKNIYSDCVFQIKEEKDHTKATTFLMEFCETTQKGIAYLCATVGLLIGLAIGFMIGGVL